MIVKRPAYRADTAAYEHTSLPEPGRPYFGRPPVNIWSLSRYPHLKQNQDAGPPDSASAPAFPLRPPIEYPRHGPSNFRCSS
jgi:hypothetical protein